MEYNPEQLSMVYLNLEERIPPTHLVRFVSSLIEKLDMKELYDSYSEEGRPAYHPMMMLKVIVYAYMMGIYTSRKIARAIRENIYFMWLAAEQQPDHRTINDFVSGRCSRYLERIFCQVVLFAQEAGYLSLNNSFESFLSTLKFICCVTLTELSRFPSRKMVFAKQGLANVRHTIIKKNKQAFLQINSFLSFQS